MAADEIPPVPVAIALAALIVGAWSHLRFVEGRAGPPQARRRSVVEAAAASRQSGSPR
jgi:hypothetical protein